MKHIRKGQKEGQMLKAFKDGFKQEIPRSKKQKKVYSQDDYDDLYSINWRS
ncbi:MAG TPA: hypothetical protein PL093_02800 [Candidatus Pacearchaeota archaeon]|nr:hypothetical protein [Candidatus Pacearchaeota archaeon]HQK58686.1 hypothetical protein [Candidatus Pacearchaeota archaeon]HRR94942.1 hypothetical protein [Candidatus Paceibacterota bacterium]HRU20972.1 hypothetical protein [Candidatus Paceibacterota bacterium]